MKMIYSFPPSLSPGDTIGIIAPAAQLQDKRDLETGISILTDMGFELKFPRDLWPGAGYLADSDQNRAEEFNRLWADPEVDGLLALRGGYGCLRMLEMIDLDLVKARPKMLIGFSDLTVLHSYLFSNTGICSLHGPVLTSLASLSRNSLERFFQSLTGKWAVPLGEKRATIKKIEILQGDQSCSGRLLGGNLCSLMTLIGTQFEPQWDKAILFLEETGEALYKMDRMLTQLVLTGKLNKLSGLILGDFSPNKGLDKIEQLRHQEYIWKRVLDLLPNTEFPIWGGLPIGHGHENMTLPHGAWATMDVNKAQLLFDPGLGV